MGNEFSDNYRLNLIKRGKKSLAEDYPDIAKEWHPTKNGNLNPNDVTYKSITKVWWQCTEGHEWETRISNRNYGRNCPKCAKKQK